MPGSGAGQVLDMNGERWWSRGDFLMRFDARSGRLGADERQGCGIRMTGQIINLVAKTRMATRHPTQHLQLGESMAEQKVRKVRRRMTAVHEQAEARRSLAVLTRRCGTHPATSSLFLRVLSGQIVGSSLQRPPPVNVWH